MITLPGAILLSISIIGFKYRKPWVFNVSLVASLLVILLFPIGTIVAFDAWDTHQDRISLIDFTWQYDVSEATVDQWFIDFGMTGQANENKFKQYLWTLGLSNHDSSEKLSLQRLRDELQVRTWVQ